jgi:hypothetical protein
LHIKVCQWRLNPRACVDDNAIRFDRTSLCELQEDVILISSNALAADDRIVYEPLSTEARELGRLEKYKSIKRKRVTLELDGIKLAAEVPARANAYDVVPIEFTMTGEALENDRIAFEAVAFEDEKKRKGRDLYDLALPGKMALKIEYRGSQTGVFNPDRVSQLTQTSRHTTFPPYELEPMVRSGAVKQGDYLFFKFRITNVGDTILDAEGFGGWMAWPEAVQVDPKSGQELKRYVTVNQYLRHLKYLYPGESFEQWVHFHGAGQGIQKARTLPIGTYKIRYRAAYRDNREYSWITNMWGGRTWTGLEVPIRVVEDRELAPVPATKELNYQSPESDRMTRYVRSLEEFMTSFKVFERNEIPAGRSQTMYLQVAPWTRHVVLKLIGNKPGQIKTAAVPIEIDRQNLAITFNPDNPFVVETDGRKEVAFCTQNMAAMRTTTQLGPHPERHMADRLKEAIDLGVNLLCTTGGNWHQAEISNANAFVGDVHAETFKYYYDVIVPNSNIPVTGWGVFPAKTASVLQTGSFYWGEKFDVPYTGDHYAYHGGRGDLDVGHPDYPKLQAGAILFNYKRWGDFWYRTADGDTLIDIEDSWGWLRDDINVRYYLGDHALKRFHSWLEKKYQTIDRINAAWGTDYKTIEEIDPQKDQGNEGTAFGLDLSRIAPVYNKKDHTFHDWTSAVLDWDIFRTELRCDVYEDILDIVREEIPQPQINIRTEGGFIPVDIPPDAQSAHLRHSYYCQRRQALVADVLKRRGVFKYHSDYTTIPYTEQEWAYLLKLLREQGMRGNYLPQFCTARDMVLNDRYGRDFSINYNLDEPSPAVMMHVLQAAYPVWKITYEQGHCPGVLWEDYMCDGFVTETQKRELSIFRDALDELIPELNAN